MGDKTGIQWADATWNPIVGCSIVSPACTNCYAMAQAARIQRMAAGAGKESHYDLTTKEINGKPVWTGVLKQAPDHILTLPLRWKKPRRIFVNSMSDLFHEGVPEKWIDEVFAVAALCPQHTFQFLTKRPKRMREYINAAYALGGEPKRALAIEDSYRTRTGERLWRIEIWPLPNVWLGVTAERQREADERRDDLQAIAEQGWTTFVSYEPALGPVDWLGWEFVRQIICGGESGNGGRPMHPLWARTTRDFCKASGVAFFFKQWGEWAPRDDWSGLTRAETMTAIMRDGRRCPDDTPPQEIGAHRMARVGKLRAGRLLDGREHNEFPEARS